MELLANLCRQQGQQGIDPREFRGRPIGLEGVGERVHQALGGEDLVRSFRRKRRYHRIPYLLNTVGQVVPVILRL